MQTFNVRSNQAMEFIEITHEVQNLLRQQDRGEGLAYVFIPHTTAGITINENADPTVAQDMMADLQRLIPSRQPYYAHLEGNSASHFMTSLMGSSVIVPVEGSQIALGTWQGIFLCEFDGPRTRKVQVSFIPDPE
ncbi:MAG: secondary thiamine-phosphate synthase enzyme YjbQ [Anaerolineales bacterium]|nr:secondary thiamine-phosphate synthase enzyme YjbQ [Anaerolineales bacterium]